MEQRVFLACTSTSLFIIKNRTGIINVRNLETGDDAEVMEECYLLVCFSWLAKPANLQKYSTTSPGWLTHNGLVSHHTNQWLRKCSTALHIDQSYGGIFSFEVPSSVGHNLSQAGIKLAITSSTSQMALICLRKQMNHGILTLMNLLLIFTWLYLKE